MPLMGKYMKPCGKIESFWKGKLGYLLWENVFLMWKPWIPCIVTGSPREKFWEHKWVLTNSLMGILLVAVFFSAAGEKILVIWPSICMFSSAKTPFLCYQTPKFSSLTGKQRKTRNPLWEKIWLRIRLWERIRPNTPPPPGGVSTPLMVSHNSHWFQLFAFP